MKTNFEPHVCGSCNQTTDYVLGIDRGTVDIVRAISSAIEKKGINVIHPRKEMEREKANIEQGHLTSNQVGNLSRPRFHGLIATIDGQPGNYCLTRKGQKFLNGEAVPKFAIVSKVEGHQIGYFLPEESTCKIGDFKNPEEYWEAVNYEIKDGRVIHPGNIALCPQCKELKSLDDIRDFGHCLDCETMDDDEIDGFIE